MPRLRRITVPELSIARDFTAARRRLMVEFPDVEEVVATTAPGTLVVFYSGREDVDGWVDALRGQGARRQARDRQATEAARQEAPRR